jgi:low molecular weight phosphotyrosine protein phosphatase
VFKQGKTDLFDGIDSFGTGTYHAGESADSRSVAACRKHGVTVNHRAQKIQSRHFNDFDYLLAMDDSNYEDLIEMAARFHGNDNYRAKIQLFGDYKTDSHYRKIVSDPYYGGARAFDENFSQIWHFSENFLKHVTD